MLCLQYILEKVITTLTFSDYLFKQQMDERIIIVISYSKRPTYLALQVYVLQEKKRKPETPMTVCCSWSELLHSNQCSSLSSGRTGLYRTQATCFTLNLPTDLQWLWSHLLAFCANFALPVQPLELTGVSLPHKYLHVLSHQAWFCRGRLICIWRYQNLAEQASSIPKHLLRSEVSTILTWCFLLSLRPVPGR